MQVAIQYLFLICLNFIVEITDSSDVLCTKWTNETAMSFDEINAIMKYIGDSVPIFNNASEELNVTAAIENYDYHAKHDQLLNITEIIKRNGYKVETHYVTTSDGYILCLFRIVGTGVPVFLMHGLVSSAADWCSTGKDRALALLLARLGRDVWLGNARGNVYSRRHVDLSPECEEFWDYSWHEIGVHDLPAMIDYVLNETNYEALQYVGHSQGTTAFFVMCSEKPEYNKKIIKMIGLSAVVWMKHAKNPILQLISPASPVLSLISRALGLYELTPRNEFSNAVSTAACGTPETAKVFCHNIVFLMVGFDYAQTNSSYLPQFYHFFPSSSSLKQLLHYSQEVVSGYFRQYDHGHLKNFAVYGSAEPPNYNVGNVTVPVYLFHAENDFWSSIKDVKVLISKLPNFKDLFIVPFKSFNHLDYMYGNDVKTLVHDEVISLLNNSLNKTT